MSELKNEKKQDTPADTGASQGEPADTEAPQGTQGEPGVTQGTPAEPGATRTDQGDGKVDKPVDEQVDGKVKKASGKRRRQYGFPTLSRCPRCKTTDTVATSTQGKVQHRRCRRAICRWTYTVMGTKV